jgi:hypothetical protein
LLCARRNAAAHQLGQDLLDRMEAAEKGAARPSDVALPNAIEAL